MAVGVLRQQWSPGYTEFVPDWSEAPVGVLLLQQCISGYTEFVPNWSELPARVLLRQQLIPKYIEFVTDCNKLPVGVLLRQQCISGNIEFIPDYWSKLPVVNNVSLDRTFLSGPGYGAADAHGVANLLKTLTTSNNVQAAVTLLITLSKLFSITQSSIIKPPLFKNLSVVNAECSDILEIEPSDVLVEIGEFEQTTMETDSGSTYVITSRPTPKYYVTLQWKGLVQNDVDKVTSIYFTTTKAFGRTRSFKWKHPIDNKVYVVRFVDNLNTDHRAEITNRESIKPIQLEILGISAG